jgi:hypothetical protein
MQPTHVLVFIIALLSNTLSYNAIIGEHYHVGNVLPNLIQTASRACTLQTRDGVINLNPLELESGAYVGNESDWWSYQLNICGPLKNFTYASLCRTLLPNGRSYQVSMDGEECYPASAAGTDDILPIQLICYKPIWWRRTTLRSVHLQRMATRDIHQHFVRSISRYTTFQI